MSSKTTVKSFINQFVGLLEGDDAKVIAAKALRQRVSALTSHISSAEGDTVDFEESLDAANEALVKTRVNHGKLISDRKAYIQALVIAKNNVTIAEDNLDSHKDEIKFLKEELALEE